jgi:hypothetical protein
MNNFRNIALYLLLTFGTQILYGQFIPIKSNKIDEKSMNAAVQLAEKLLNGMKEGSIYLLTNEEATEAMAKGLTAETQESVYARIKEENGDFVSLNFTAALKPENDKSLTIYRFRGEFEKIKDGPEIRVVMNKDLKLAGFWILPWRDDIQGP